MFNTDLPTNLNANSSDHVPHHNTVHAAVNESSRDTGQRDLSGMLTNGWELATNSGIVIQRTRDVVYLYVRGLVGTNASDPYFIAFGTGENELDTAFLPLMSSYRSSVQTSTSINTGDQWVLETTSLGIRVPYNYSQHLGAFGRVFCWPAQHRTRWPKTLPPEL